jgi:hypothetical protein
VGNEVSHSRKTFAFRFNGRHTNIRYWTCLWPSTERIPQAQQSYFVHDFLVDQSQSTDGGSALVDPIQFSLDNNASYRYVLQAPAGKSFLVELPTSVSSFYFSAWLGRQITTGPSGGVFTSGSAKITFAALSGMSPQISYNNFSITQSNNDAIIFEIEGTATSSFGFASLTIEGDYAQRALDPGPKSYDPLSYAVPLGTKSIYPKSETFVLFGYHTAQKTDPGRFVRIAQLIAGG